MRHHFFNKTVRMEGVLAREGMESPRQEPLVEA
jgi:hypothetical protein